MKFISQSVLLFTASVLATVNPVLAQQPPQKVEPVQVDTQSEVNALPNKAAALNQKGIDNVMDELRSNPELAKKTASLIKSNPRAAIERVFRLAPQQAENLKSLSDEELVKMLSPLAEAIEEGNLDNTKIDYQLEPANPGDAQLNRKCKVKIVVTIG